MMMMIVMAYDNDIYDIIVEPEGMMIVHISIVMLMIMMSLTFVLQT